MPGTIAIHTEVLSSAQSRVIHRLSGPLRGTDFYMAGGTALALQVGHRPSLDVDWFIPRLGNPEHLFYLLKSCHIDFEVQSIGPETVYIVSDTVQMSFMGYDYPLLSEKVLWPDTGISLASLDDIGCMKLSALASRGSRKDFMDLHYLFTHFYPLEEFLKLYKKKYTNRDVGHVIRSLVYFADAEREPDILTFKPVHWETLKSDFETWVQQLNLERFRGL